MMTTLKAVEHLAIILPVVADEFNEQGLSKEETVELLRKLLGQAAQNEYVQRATQRIEEADEFDLWLTMSHECVTALHLCDAIEGRS